MTRSLGKSWANTRALSTPSPEAKGDEEEAGLRAEAGSAAGGRAKSPVPSMLTASPLSLQVASIGAPGAQALGEALAVNRTLEILE